MKYYKIEVERIRPGVILLKIGFGEPARNTEIVKEVEGTLKALNMGGGMVLMNGPASLPVAMVLAHYLAHRFEIVGVFDPKLGGYVVSISHNPDYPVGGFIKEEIYGNTI